MSPLFALPLTLAAGATVIAVTAVGAWYIAPNAMALLYALFSRHSTATGCWLALSIIGADYMLIASRNALSYRNVGQKSLAHWHLSGGGK